MALGNALRSIARNPAMRNVQLALTACLVGDAAFATAVTVWAYGEGGAAAVGAFTAARLVAAAVLAPVGTALADRYPRRPVLLVCLGARAVLVAAAALALAADLPAAVYTLAAAAGVLNAPFRSTVRAWLPALAREPAELTASNATASTIESLSVLAGPALGALLVAMVGVAPVFWFNTVLFVVALLLMATVRPTRADRVVLEHESALAQLVGGFRLIGQDADLRNITAQVSAQTFVGGACRVLFIVLAVEVMGTGPSGVGVLDAIVGAGAVVGGVVALARAGRHRLGRDLSTGVILWSVPLALVVVWEHPIAVVVMLLLLGTANPVVDVNLDTIVQRMTPDHLLARAFGALDTFYIATSAAGAFVTPLLLDAVGLRTTLVIIGLPVFFIALASWPRMRRLDARLVPPPYVDLLRGLPLFAGLAPAVLEQLARGSQVEELPAGTPVIRQGETGRTFHVIVDGQARVTQDGRELRIQGPGEFFGEIALLNDVPRTASVTATTDLVLLTLDREIFLRALTGEALSAAHDVAAGHLRDDEQRRDG